jgi:hypothetical protein
MHTIPDRMAEPVTRLMVEQPQLFAFFWESGIFLIEDDEDNPTAKTDGKRWIRVNPVFMKKCYNGEEGSPGADIFVLAHEIMHCALMHGEWLASVHEHGFTLNEALVREIRKFNPSTRWRAGMVIPAELAPHLIQWALDYVINALLWEWGMKITPYIAFRDPTIALWTDAEDTAFCRLIGRELIEPPEAGDGEDDPNPGSSSSQKPGAGGSDMIESYADDLPEEAGPAPYDQQRRKMGVEIMLKEIAEQLEPVGAQVDGHGDSSTGAGRQARRRGGGGARHFRQHRPTGAGPDGRLLPGGAQAGSAQAADPARCRCGSAAGSGAEDPCRVVPHADRPGLQGWRQHPHGDGVRVVQGEGD